MKTQTLNTYKVTFHVTLEVDAAHEDDAPVLAGFDLQQMLDEVEFRREADTWAYTVELIDGIEPGQED